MIRKNWHWDVNIPYTKIERILRREEDPRFPWLAGTLLSRVDDAKQVFDLITPAAFCRHYRAIEKEILSDAWTREKAALWKTIYLRLMGEFKAKGEKIRKPTVIRLDAFDSALIKKVKECRKTALMSQKEFARSMKYSQQYISGIETGREKITVEFLRKVARITGQRIDLTIQ